MDSEKVLNPNESLALITDIINKTKENISQHSFLFLQWGWLVPVASIFRFVLTYFTQSKYSYLPFPIFGAIATFISILYYSRRKIINTETYLSYFIKRLWVGIIIGMVLVVFVSVYQGIQPSTYMLILTGVGTFITGLLIKFKPIIVGGVLLLASSIVCCFIVNEYKFLVVGVSFIPGCIYPGYLLKKVTSFDGI
ncbi:MAG: hypothetical protein HYZ42_13015 [Bacteroidetes bacterium]|nr:hypothetical protein [Bacteroidota bacterium]